MSDKKARQKRVQTEPNGHRPEEHPQVATAVGKELGSNPIPWPSVIVMRVPGDEPGQENIQIAELNGIDPLAVPTLLRIAANIRQNQLGISQ